MRSTFGAETVGDVVLLVARILLVLLFVIFGWKKLIGFGGTVAYFSHNGVPMPFLAALIAVAMELVAGVAIALGLFTRPLALLMALYTLGTALLGHPFWNLAGTARVEAEINFLKNVGLIGGFLLLYVTGAGRYSLDDKIDAI
jgi:putative oxidoreductase